MTFKEKNDKNKNRRLVAGCRAKIEPSMFRADSVDLKKGTIAVRNSRDEVYIMNIDEFLNSVEWTNAFCITNPSILRGYFKNK